MTVAVSKTNNTSTTLNEGGVQTTTLSFFHLAPAGATNFNVFDPLPFNVASRTWTRVITGAGATATGPASGTGTINQNLVVPLNTNIVYTINDTIATGAGGGDYSNSADITGGVAVTASSSPVPINLPPPAISLTKTTAGTATRSPGGTIVSTVTVTNTGGPTVVPLALTDNLVVGFPTRNWSATYTGAASGPFSGSGGLSGVGINLPAGTSATFTITDNNVTSGSATYTNTATIAASPTNGTPALSASGQTVTITPPPAATVTKTTAGASTRSIGDVIVSTVTVTNNNATTITPTFSDVIPTGIPGTTRTWTQTLNGGATATGATSGVGDTLVGKTLTIPAGDSVVFTTNDTVNAAGFYFNVAVTAGVQTFGPLITVAAAPPTPPTITSPAACGSSTTTNQDIDTVVNPNGLATTVSVDYGTTNAYGSNSILATFIAGITTDQTINATVGGLTPGTTYHYRLVATNSAGTTTGPDFTCTTASPPPPAFNSASKALVSPLAGPVAAGSTITSTITLDNSFFFLTGLFNISDPIPAGVSARSWVLNGTASSAALGWSGATSGTGAINQTGLSVPPGESYTIVIDDTVDGSVTPYINTATDSVVPTVSSTPPLVVSPPPPPVVTLTKTISGASGITVGQPITYIVRAINTGPGVATVTNISDPLPTLGAPTRTWSRSHTGGSTGGNPTGTGAISEGPFTMPVGSQITFTVTDIPTVPVLSTDPGMVNTASLTVPVGTPPTPPSTTTTVVPAIASCAPATAVTDTAATFNVTINNLPSGWRARIQYGTTPGGPYPINGPYVTGNNTVGQVIPFTTTGLLPSTAYYWRSETSEVVTGLVTRFSSECSITTDPTPVPTGTCGGSSGITTSGFTMTATGTNVPVTDLGHFEWGTVSGVWGSRSVGVPGNGLATQSFSATATGLAPGTPYFWRFVITSADDTTIVVASPECDPGGVVTLVPGNIAIDCTPAPLRGPAVTPGSGTVNVVDLTPVIDAINTLVDTELLTLCDSVGPFVRRIVFSEITGLPISTVNLTPAGAAYTPVGVVTTCPTTSGDTEFTVLCDTNGAVTTQFLRRITYTNGVPSAVVNTTLDGVTAYVPTGSVAACADAIELDNVETVWCVGGVQLVRHDIINNSTGAVTTTSWTTPAGATATPLAADVLAAVPGACALAVPAVLKSRMTNIVPASAWTPAISGGTLTSVSFTVVSGTASITDANGTVSTGIPTGFSGSWESDDANTLTGPQSIASVGGNVVVVWTTK